MGSLYQESVKGAARAIEMDGRWLICESAIVADVDDPEKQHRIRVIIPVIDDDLVYDDWVRPLTPFAMGDGFGAVFMPPKGSEVLVTGVLGQKFNLVYHGAVYNESMRKPSELDADTSGFKIAKNLSWIVGLLLKMVAQNVEIIAQQLVKISGATIRSEASGLNKTTGSTVESLSSGENKLQGATVIVNSDGSMTIAAGGNVAVTAGGSMTLEGRQVMKAGPPI